MRQVILLILSTILIACSSVDSTKPFDEPAAAHFLTQGSTFYPAKDRVKIHLKNKEEWQRIDMSYGTIGSPIMLIPKNQTRHTWTESIRTYIYPYQKDPNMNAEKWIKIAIASATNHCARVSTDHLTVGAKSALYQISMYECGDGDKSQVRIGKAFNGEDAVYVVYYTAILGAVTDERIRHAAGSVDNATLVKNPSTLYRSSSIHD